MYQNALQAQGQAANQGITAMQNAGALGSEMYGQEAQQANTVAAAQNALNQFNSANTQQANLANQATQQAANTYNTQNAQNISNQNVQGQQTVQEQNQVAAPQEAAGLALQKGQEESQIGQAQANQQTAAGQQSAGLFGGLLGDAATLGSGYFTGNALSNLAGSGGNDPGAFSAGVGPGGVPIPSSIVPAARGGEIPEPKIPATAFLRGGQVPGQAQVAGDNPVNDTVPARLSPGEYVIPRTVMANPGVRNLVARLNPAKPPAGAHPNDLASVLKALSMLRGEAA
jgi:hypothetical protein